MGTPTPATPVIQDEVKAKLQLLDNLQQLFVSHLNGTYEEWPGEIGTMYNLFLKNQNAESPVKEMTNREGEVVKIATIGELMAQTAKNLKKSGFWIHFTIQIPNGKGGTIPTKVDMWSFSNRDGGYIVAKGRNTGQTTISGSVSRTEPKAMKFVDESGKETATFKADFSSFVNKSNAVQSGGIS